MPKYTAETDGRLQVMAGTALLEKSKLVEWNANECRFFSVERDAFESYWQNEIDPVFGRLLCWIVFSAGAEFLVKGVCLLRGVDIRSEKQVPSYPTGNVKTWAAKFCDDWKRCDTVSVTHFGALGDLLREDKHQPESDLRRLCADAGAKSTDCDLLVAAYGLLGRSIRNRDAHAYVPNVRDSHLDLVPKLFTDCFNLLVSWLPDGRCTLNMWRQNARQFVASLQ